MKKFPRKQSFYSRLRTILILFSFVFNLVLAPFPSSAQPAQNFLPLPAPGAMIPTTNPMAPLMMKGIRLDSKNPLRFNFIVDTGKSGLRGEALKKESTRLIKYFLASLTTPSKDIWVNLSPYEKERIVPEIFGITEMAKDMLAQDYILKQMTASLMYPEQGLGKKFWDRVYEKAQSLYGTTNIPINTFNKVWIIPEKAVVYKDKDMAFVLESRLKVMLEGDYLALRRNLGNEEIGLERVEEKTAEGLNDLSSGIVKEVILPELEREVNEGENFALLRQIYNSLILATWFKKNLKASLLGKMYVDKDKVGGVDVEDKTIKEKIFEQYLEAFKVGVYNYIREDYDETNHQTVQRKYFAGGMDWGERVEEDLEEKTDPADISTEIKAAIEDGITHEDTIGEVNGVDLLDKAMLSPDQRYYELGVNLNLTIADHITSTSALFTPPTAPWKVKDPDTIARGKIVDFLNLSVKNKALRNAIKEYLEAQNTAAEQMSFLPVDLPNVWRVIQNTRNLLGTNDSFQRAVNQALDLSGDLESQNRSALKIALIAALLLKVGYGHPDLPAYSQNREFTLKILETLEEKGLVDELGISREVYDAVFKTAIKTEGIFGEGTAYTADKYKNPLAALLSLAAEMDVSRARMNDWQKSEVIMKRIVTLTSRPRIEELRKEILKLNLKMSEGTDQEFITKKAALEEELQKSIQKEILDKEQEIRLLLQRVEGKTEDESRKIIEAMKNGIKAINGDTYLWFIGSYGIENSRINEEGQPELDVSKDQFPLLGAAANLSVIRQFHIYHLNALLAQINEALGTDLNLRINDVRENQDMYDLIAKVFNSETHAHQKMSLDFEQYIWRFIFLGQTILDESVGEGELESHKKDILASEGSLAALLKEQGIQDIDIKLVDLIKDARSTLQTLEKLLQKYLPRYEAPPENRDRIIEDAENLLASKNYVSKISTEDREAIVNAIDLFGIIKFQARDLYNFQEGPLTKFVIHFMAGSKLLKVAPGAEELETLQNITKEGLTEYQKIRNAYLEWRFNIGNVKGTLEEMLATLQAYAEFQEENPGVINPTLKLILSITKFSDQDYATEEERSQHKIESARVLLSILRQAIKLVLEDQGEVTFPASFVDETGQTITLNNQFNFSKVTPKLILESIVGIDAAGQEEFNQPDLFFEAFRLIVDEYNAEVQAATPKLKEKGVDLYTLGLTSHVSESNIDVSPESALRYTPEIIYLAPLENTSEDAKPKATRGGHLIKVWVDNFDVVRGQRKTERVAERIKQIRHDLELIKRGMPLFNPLLEVNAEEATRDALEGSSVEAKLKAELADLELYQQYQRGESVPQGAKSLEEIIRYRKIGGSMVKSDLINALASAKLDKSVNIPETSDGIFEQLIQQGLLQLERDSQTEGRFHQNIDVIQDVLKFFLQDKVSAADLEKILTVIQKLMSNREVVIYYYDDAKTLDLQTRQAFVRDLVIRNGVWTETNPTSNLGVGSEYIYNYAMHTVKALLSYSFGQWFTLTDADKQNNTFHGQKISAQQRAAIEAYLEKNKDFIGKKAPFSISTDDLTLFGTNVVEEIYRVAVALKLTKDQVLDILQNGFRSRMWQGPLAQDDEIKKAIIKERAESTYQSLNRALENLPVAIQVKLEETYAQLQPDKKEKLLAEIKAAQDLLKAVKQVYTKAMRIKKNGQETGIPEGLLLQNYHNHVHNLMVTFGTLTILENTKLIETVRDLKVSFLAGVFHDFHVRLVQDFDQEKSSATAAYVPETLQQMANIFLGRPYNRAIDDGRYNEADLPAEFRSVIDEFLGDEIKGTDGTISLQEKEKIFNEMVALIRRTDFTPEPIEYSGKTNEIRAKLAEMLDNLIKTKNVLSPEDLDRVIAAAEREYQMISQDNESNTNRLEDRKQIVRKWVDRQRDIETNYLRALQILDEGRRVKIYLLANYLEVADQSVATWLVSIPVADQIVNGLKVEIPDVGNAGNYPFFYKNQFLRPQILSILKYLPVSFKINFVRRMEGAAILASQVGASFTQEFRQEKPGLFNAFFNSLTDWKERRDDVLVQLGLYRIGAKDEDRISEILEETAPRLIVDGLRSSMFAKHFNLEEIHKIANHPFIRVLEFGSNTTILNEGEKPSLANSKTYDDFYLVLSGSVDVLKGKTKVATLKPGQYFGEIAILRSTDRNADIVTTEPTEVLQVPTSLLEALRISNPQFNQNLYDIISEEQRDLQASSPLSSSPFHVIVEMKRQPNSDEAVFDQSVWQEPVKKISIVNISLESVSELVPEVLTELKEEMGVPAFKSVIISGEGPLARVIEDPSDRKLILVFYAKLFQGQWQSRRAYYKEMIKWFLRHELRHIQRGLQRTYILTEQNVTDKRAKLIEEGIVLFNDLLDDSNNERLPDAIGYLDNLIGRTEADDKLHPAISRLKQFYEIFKEDTQIQPRLVEFMAKEILLQPDTQFLELLKDQLTTEGIEVVDRALLKSQDASLAMTADKLAEIKDAGAVNVTGDREKEQRGTQKVGGIDFSDDIFNVEEQGTNGNFMTPENIRNLERIPIQGINPVIFTIKPVLTLPFLNISAGNNKTKSAIDKLSYMNNASKN